MPSQILPISISISTRSTHRQSFAAQPAVGYKDVKAANFHSSERHKAWTEKAAKDSLHILQHRAFSDLREAVVWSNCYFGFI